MIVKYLKDGVWGFIDNVRQVANKELDASELIAQYDEEVKKGEREDIASKNVMSSSIATVNKVYLMAGEITSDLRDEGLDGHEENLLLSDLVERNFPVHYLLLYLNDHKEYDTLMFVTNQTTYLMNDKGQTIERLV